MSRFGLYWSSATASYLGDGVRFAALPLLASSLSSSPADVAWVSGAVGLPWLLFGLVAGVIVDRVQRARLMALVQLARAVVGGAVVAAVAGGRLTIPSLVLLVFLLSTCEVLYDVASNAVLPAIVDRRRLQWANGRLIAAEVVALEFAGPALGGMLFAVGAALPFAFDAASFLGSAVLLLVVAIVSEAFKLRAERITISGAFLALGGYAMGMYLMRQIGSRGVYGNPLLPDFMVFLNWKELPVAWYGMNLQEPSQPPSEPTPFRELA